VVTLADDDGDCGGSLRPTLSSVPSVARTWLEITVELVGGGTLEDLWPRPGRTFVAARSHSFEQLAEAIDDAFGRWDLNHLHEFVLADGTCLGSPDPESDEGRVIFHARRVKLSRLAPGERFAYVFDLRPTPRGAICRRFCRNGDRRAARSRTTCGRCDEGLPRGRSGGGRAASTSAARTEASTLDETDDSIEWSRGPASRL
jgi:hypothetical protein